MVEWLGEWGTWGLLVEWENLLTDKLLLDWVDSMEYSTLPYTVNECKYL
jgi:hypothetical protein